MRKKILKNPFELTEVGGIEALFVCIESLCPDVEPAFSGMEAPFEMSWRKKARNHSKVGILCPESGGSHSEVGILCLGLGASHCTPCNIVPENWGRPLPGRNMMPRI